MIGRPQRSTLSPTTTLFRSGGVVLHPPRMEQPDPGEAAQQDRRKELRGPVPCAGPEQPGGGRRRRPPPPDRKSTRLNSSHANISYAVFCLKKKKNVRSKTTT